MAFGDCTDKRATELASGQTIDLTAKFNFYHLSTVVGSCYQSLITERTDTGTWTDETPRIKSLDPQKEDFMGITPRPIKRRHRE